MGQREMPGLPAHPYRGARAVLATMHGKEQALAPVFGRLLGLKVEAAPGIDTDALGTFTGEVPRHGSMRQVAVRKARLGMAMTRLPIGIASEGSYGPHPYFPFLAAGQEIIAIVDDVHGLELTESLVAHKTNFGHAIAADAGGLGDFLTRAQFPSHRLIVSPNQPIPAAGPGPFVKGIGDLAALGAAMQHCAALSQDGLALVQTDMRAHMNPTRMQMLRLLAERLAERLLNACPGCAAPGCGLIDVKRGLPCQCCGAETELVAREVHGCSACGLREDMMRADARALAEPGDCPSCNP